jgi:hypothetical protein
MPTAPKEERERFLFIPSDVGRYLNVVFAASPDAAARTIVGRTTDPETGAEMVSRVRSFVVDGRHLYSPHLRVFFALYAIMRRTAPDTEGYYHGDFRDLAREVGFKWHGTAGRTVRGRLNTHRSMSTPRLLAQLCRELRVNGYYVENVFYDQIAKEWVNRWDDPVNLLESFSLEIRVPGTGDHEARMSFRFKISEHARRVFLQDTLPVPHQAVRRIDGRNNLAPMLLTYLGTVMADKTAWDRYTDELLREDLRYTRTPGKPAEQRRVLNRALRYVNGAMIPTGTLTTEIRPSTVDRRRNVLHVSKAPFQQALKFVPSSQRPDDRRGARQQWQRRPTKDEGEKIGEWTSELLAFAGDEHSAVFYETTARRFILSGNEQSLFSALADAKDLDRSGYIQKTRAHTITRNLLAEGNRLRIPLRRSPLAGDLPAATHTPPTPVAVTSQPPAPTGPVVNQVAPPRTPQPPASEPRRSFRDIVAEHAPEIAERLAARERGTVAEPAVSPPPVVADADAPSRGLDEDPTPLAGARPPGKAPGSVPST